MAKKKFSYREAITEIEKIISEIDTADLDLDEIQDKVQRFKFLMEQCKKKLRETEDEINKMGLDD